MSKLSLTIGKKAVQVDTENLSASQGEFNSALSELETEARKPVEAELNAAKEHIVGGVIAQMKATKDAALSARVKTDEDAKKERDYLMGLPMERLTAEARRVGEITKLAGTAEPNTEGGEPAKAPEGGTTNPGTSTGTPGGTGTNQPADKPANEQPNANQPGGKTGSDVTGLATKFAPAQRVITSA